MDIIDSVYFFCCTFIFLTILILLCLCTEKFFDMTQQQCKNALEIYKKFVARMDRVRTFLRVAQVRRTDVIVVCFRSFSSI